jgi:hypothetical protein
MPKENDFTYSPEKRVVLHTNKYKDAFAIGFLEFTENRYSFGNINGKWYLHANTKNEYTTKQLLKIYKKEKGL